MTIGTLRTSVLVAGMLALVATASPAQVLDKSFVKCFQSVTKGGLGLVKTELKLYEKCHDANLKDGSCTAPDPGAITKAEGKLTTTIQKGCPFTPLILGAQGLGFPGPCTDPNPGDGFTVADLALCMQTSHENIVSEMLALEYDSSLTGPLAPTDLKCQEEVGKLSGAFATCVLKTVQKCRIGVMSGKVSVPATLCATADPKTKAGITKCQGKLVAGLAGKCTDTQIANLKVCTPDQTSDTAASTCLDDAHTLLVDGPRIDVPPDLIDFEFARPGVCGDNVVNNLDEECDGTDDSACPGQCGTAFEPNGDFACLCKTKPRMWVYEHADADTDNGWVGTSSDGHVVEGGGYLVDLYDCDNTGLCIAGPNCSLAPHSPCGVADGATAGTTGDSICAGLGQGTCRKERTAAGPHCHLDIQKKCNLPGEANQPVCTGDGDFCETTFHGAPVAQSAGGVAVCNISTFSEDVVGTVNINDGTGSVKARQRAVTYFGMTQDKPCPVCGGFCQQSRGRCAVDADCNGLGPCILDDICSDGANQDQPCRSTAPFAGAIPLFGTTSVDCPPAGGSITSAKGLDINANPRTTGTVTLTPSFPCSGAGFTGNACVGGSSEGRPCTTGTECPGGACKGQCFCAGELLPNACNAACVGGGNDAAPCGVDSECPGGFCHAGDCRADPTDMTSNQEGHCTGGPVDGACSITSSHSCNQDADCQPGPNCVFCQSGETCVHTKRACFVNSGIIRIGSPRLPEGHSAAVYCVPGDATAINTSAGFPGPGALIQHETVTVVP